MPLIWKKGDCANKLKMRQGQAKSEGSANIRNAHIHSNAGVDKTNMVGELLGYRTVWY